MGAIALCIIQLKKLRFRQAKLLTDSAYCTYRESKNPYILKSRGFKLQFSCLLCYSITHLHTRLHRTIVHTCPPSSPLRHS